MQAPKVFISATSGDLRSVRGIVKEALLTIGCHPIEQSNFPPDYRNVHNMLEERIADCQALVHIIGMRYGAEPDINRLPLGTARRSYTQMEYDIGRALQKKRGAKRFRVYVFVCPEDFPYDPEPDTEAADKRTLQLAHRRCVLQGDSLYEPIEHLKALETRIYSLREETLALINTHKKRQRGLWAGIGVLSLLLIGGGIGLVHYLPSRTADAVWQQADADMIAAKLRTEIDARFQHDAEELRKNHKDWQELRKLEQQRDQALLKVDEVIATIRTGLAGNPDPIFKEATRLLQQQGSDAALGYLESHKNDLLARADIAANQVQAAEEKLHQALEPLLLQAGLYETSQQWDASLLNLQLVATKAPHWLMVRVRLGMMYLTLARFSEAETELKSAVDLAQNDNDKAAVLNNYALLLKKTNRLSEAEPLMRRSLAIYEKSYGSEHPRVAAVLNNLAQLLQATNRLSEAEPLMRRSLAIDEKSYGSEHPDVARALNNLAELLQATNRLSEAEPLMRRSLAIYEKSYGSEHPAVARALNNLAGLLQATNRLSEAEPLMRRSLAIDEKSYGSEHPDVAGDLNNLAQLLQATNRLSEAEPLFQRSLAINEKSLGKDHPTSKLVKNNLQQLQARLKGQFQVQVKAVLPNSQGEQLGIKPQDFLILYNNKPILGVAAFIYERSLEPATNPVTELKVLRNGKQLIFKLKPGKMGAELQEQVH